MAQSDAGDQPAFVSEPVLIEYPNPDLMLRGRPGVDRSAGAGFGALHAACSRLLPGRDMRNMVETPI
jgi:hypothetical protein